MNQAILTIVYLKFRKKNSDNTRVRIFIFFVAQSAKFVSTIHHSTLDYMTKTLNQIILFPPPKSEYFFQQYWESEYFFRKKNIT